MFAPAGPRIDWFVDAGDDVCDMLPLIQDADSSVIAKEVTFDASEFFEPPAFEELPYAADFVLHGDHQLFTEIDWGIVAETNVQQVTSIATVLVCDICNVRFRCKTHLNRHRLLHHAEDLESSKKGIVSRCLQCRQCDDRFVSAKQLKLHLTIHHSKRLVCDLCLTAFQNDAALEWHRNDHLAKKNETGRYVCDVCRKQCTSSSHLHLHRKIHLEQKSYPCPFGCDRSFSSSGNRQKHIVRMHTREKKYKCTNCNESFVYARQLQRHRERKHGEFKKNSIGRIICTRCKEPFDSESSFQDHTAYDECLEHRAFQCVFCSKSFKQATHLRNHILTHQQDARAFGCEFCPKRFALAGDLKVHRRIHTKEKPFRCSVCPAAFAMGKQLNKHRFKAHQIAK